MINRKLTIAILCCGLSASPVTWAGSFPKAGVDTAPSLARFVLTVSNSFINRQADALRDQLRERFCPGRTWTHESSGEWNATPECTKNERTIISPLMYQAVTKIGRSSPHNDGDMTDERRGARICKTGSANSCDGDGWFKKRIKDAHFEIPDEAEGRPTDFQNGPTQAQDDTGVKVQEVHTQMISLDLKPLWPNWNTQTEYESANRIRAGTAAPEQPASIGEVESLSSSGKGFPAESFFNMNVEVDLDMDMDGEVDFTLITSSGKETSDGDEHSDNDLDLIGDFPLIVQGYNLQSFPPKLVYQHNATVWAVPMYDKAEIARNGGDWEAGNVGWLRLAGHGIDFGPNAEDEWVWDNRNTRKRPRAPSDMEFGIGLFNNFIEKLPILPVNPVEVQVFEKEPPRCKLYVLQDHKLNGSQIFTINPNNFEVEPLSRIYAGLDIEGLATHPSNDMIFGASGNDSERPGYLYSFDVKTGKLTEIGATGFGDVPSIDFHSDGTLWGWVKGKGLITIDIDTGKGTMVKAFPGVLVEDITWNNAGTHIYAAENTNLLVYEHATQTVGLACSNLPGETEALEMLPDGSLLLGIHGERKILQFQALNLETCEIVFGLDVPTDATINDVEGIAWPINLCSQP